LSLYVLAAPMYVVLLILDLLPCHASMDGELFHGPQSLLQTHSSYRRILLLSCAAFRPVAPRHG